MVICLERGADLHMAQLMPLPLTVSCFSKIQIGSTFLVPAHPGSPGQRDVKRVCVCCTLHSLHSAVAWHTAANVGSATFTADVLSTASTCSCAICRCLFVVGTKYPQVNSLISRYVSKYRTFPDYQDVRDIIVRCNQRHSLNIK